MVGTFLRCGSNIWLALGLAVLIVCFAAGLSVYLLWVAVGALSSMSANTAFIVSASMPSRRASPLCAHCSTGSITTITPSPTGFCSCRSGSHSRSRRHGVDLRALVRLVSRRLGDVRRGARHLPLRVGALVAHIPYQPRTAFGRWIKQYHLRHHYISEKFWFGVSNPSMDLLSGTYKEEREVQRSDGTTRKLFARNSSSFQRDDLSENRFPLFRIMLGADRHCTLRCAPRSLRLEGRRP